MQVGQTGVAPAAGKVPIAWYSAAPLVAAVVTLPPGVGLVPSLAAPPAMTAAFSATPITRYAWALASAVYAARSDLQSAFPHTKAGFQAAYLKWITSWGTGSSGGVDPFAPYLRPYLSAFQSLARAL